MSLRDELDDIDLNILRLLQEDGRTTHADLARQVGLSAPSVLQRVRKLEEMHIIKGYAALLDSERLGFSLTAFVHINLVLPEPQPVEKFRAMLVKLPEVVSCYHVSGEFDYMLEVVVEDMQAYQEFITQKLTKVAGVSRVVTSFVLAKNKDSVRLPL
ncbi:MAG: Lrp/AsnC family transcriptional regulator [Armatimonadetes bacterium]|nr:Lrp/AsnC family transcriptional regulator [Armatimonadota bacterium]